MKTLVTKLSRLSVGKFKLEISRVELERPTIRFRKARFKIDFSI